MKEWKVVALASFAANVVMVVLLIIAFVYTASTVTAKNGEIDKLQQQTTATPENIAPKKQQAVDETAASHTEDLQHEQQAVKTEASELPTEETLLASDNQTEALMHYEEAYMQATENLNNVYDTLTHELTSQEKAHLQLDQQKWLQALKSMQDKQLSKDDDNAKLEATKEAYIRTMARSEELLQRYDAN